MRIPRLAAALAAVTLVTVLSPTASASSEWQGTSGGWVSGPVEYVTTIPEQVGGAVDGIVHDDLLYVTSFGSFSIYDVSDPLAPQRLSVTPLVVAVNNERPQTNGEILLISRDAQYLPPTEDGPRGGRHLDIYDVSDPSNPTFITTYDSHLTGEFESAHDHIWACVMDCTYAYSSFGTILDLSDPAAPARVGDWSEQAPYEASGAHFIGTIAPGILMTGSLPMHVLDAREDPTAPDVLATIDPRNNALGDLPPSNRQTLVARADWPNALTGSVSVATMESPFYGNCTEEVGDVQTFRTSGWQGTRTFTAADSYQIAGNGTYTDGAPPANAVGCSAYGLDVHNGFGPTGGTIAVTFFEHGLRLLDVDERGTIRELGGFVPLAGNSFTPLWLGDDVLYSLDVERGIDILRVNAGAS